MSLQSDFQNNPIISTSNKFIGQLEALKIVDIGRITLLEPGGHYAKIALDDVSGTEIRAELISLGNNSSTITACRTGQFCLVFFPASSVDMYRAYTSSGAGAYSRIYAKALPVGTIAGNVHIDTTEDTLAIACSDYSCVFSIDNLLLQSEKLSLMLDMLQGTITLGTSSYNVKLEDTGSITTVQGGEYDQQTGDLTKAKIHSTISATGDVAIKLNEDIQGKKTGVQLDVKQDGSVSLKTGVNDDKQNCVVTIGTDGTLTATVGDEKASMILAPDGTITLKAEAKVSWEQGGVTLYEVFNEFAKILEQLQTDGAPAKHMISATSVQQISQWRTNQLGKFTE